MIKEILSRLERIDHKEYGGGWEFADSATFEEMGRCYDERKLLAETINKAIEYIKHSQSYGTMAQVMPHLKPYVNGDDLLEILGEKE